MSFATTIIVVPKASRKPWKIPNIAEIPKELMALHYLPKKWHNSRQWIGNDSLNTTSVVPPST